MEIKQNTPKKSKDQRRNCREIRKCSEMNENEDVTYENILDRAKAMLRAKLTVVNASI